MSDTFFFFPPEAAAVSFILGVNSALRGELVTRGALGRCKMWGCVRLGFGAKLLFKYQLLTLTRLRSSDTGLGRPLLPEWCLLHASQEDIVH